MGEAKLRGTFEQRKAEAIKAGRIKKPATVKRLSKWRIGPYGLHEIPK